VQTYVYADATFVPAYLIDKTTGTTRLLRYFTDERGSVRYVVNTDTGAIVQAIRYDAWGAIVEDTNPGFQPFGFAGGLIDPDTGFVQFGARDYDPATARWTRKDPLAMGGGLNFYAYANNDPVNRIDPLGLVSVDCRNWKFLVAFMPGISFLRAINDPNSTWIDIAVAAGQELPLDKALTRGLNAVRGGVHGGTSHGGFFPAPFTNSAGGSVHLSDGDIDARQFQSIVENALVYKQQKVDIISGAHGDRFGNLQPDREMYLTDVKKWASEPNVTVHDIAQMSPEKLRSVLGSDGTVVGGFCNSFACFQNRIP